MKILYILPLLLVINTGFGQGFGYYGKKNSLTLTGNFSPKLFANLIGSRSMINGAAYTIGYGATANFDRQLTAHQFIGVEFSVNFGSAKVKGVMDQTHLSSYDSYDYYGYLSSISDVSAIQYRTLSPCITYSTAYKGHISPIGIVHTFGVGALLLTVSDKPLEMDHVVTDQNTGEIVDNHPPAIDKFLVNRSLYGDKMYGARVFWQTALNVPLAKGIMWTIAARANVNVYTDMLFTSSSSSQIYHIERQQTRRQIAYTELLNVFQLNSGFKFVF